MSTNTNEEVKDEATDKEAVVDGNTTPETPVEEKTEVVPADDFAVEVG